MPAAANIKALQAALVLGEHEDALAAVDAITYADLGIPEPKARFCLWERADWMALLRCGDGYHASFNFTGAGSTMQPHWHSRSSSVIKVLHGSILHAVWHRDPDDDTKARLVSSTKLDGGSAPEQIPCAGGHAIHGWTALKDSVVLSYEWTVPDEVPGDAPNTPHYFEVQSLPGSDAVVLHPCPRALKRTEFVELW